MSVHTSGTQLSRAATSTMRAGPQFTRYSADCHSSPSSGSDSSLKFTRLTWIVVRVVDADDATSTTREEQCEKDKIAQTHHEKISATDTAGVLDNQERATTSG